MKRKRTISRRHHFSSTSSGNISSSSNSGSSIKDSGFSRENRRRPFVSFKFIRKTLLNAIENEKVEKVLEILKKYEVSQSKKQKTSICFSENAVCLVQSLRPSLVSGELPMEIDVASSKEEASKSGRQYLTSNKIFRKITWSSFCVDEENKDNALHYACRLGKTCLIDALLDTGHFNINEPNFSDCLDTCLTIACDEGQLDTAKILIARGADVNYENRKSKTPLIFATELIDPCDIELVKHLLKRNALVNKTTSNGNTALLSASKYGNVELIEMLLHANANINWEYNDGASPLMRACYYNHPHLVKYFLERGACIESKNIRKETPLYIASFRGYISIVKILIEK